MTMKMMMMMSSLLFPKAVPRPASLLVLTLVTVSMPSCSCYSLSQPRARVSRLPLLFKSIGQTTAHNSRQHFASATTASTSTTTSTASFKNDDNYSHENGSISNINSSNNNSNNKPSAWEHVAAVFSQRAAERLSQKYNDATDLGLGAERWKIQWITLIRVGIPSLLAGVVATIVFPFLAMFLASLVNDAGVFSVLSTDSSQFVQNFLTVSGLLFSILVGQTFYFMYQQQEAVYYALFNEVTEAKSLLEQVALVCQGRSMYRQVLTSISQYVQNDLKRLQDDPAILLSARPVDDPLESIMYMTSVGVPSSVYETVKSLRQARAGRLGALQRKLPSVHMMLLWILAGIELISFPLLGAGTQTIGGYNILTVEGVLFGVMTAGIVLTLRVVGELWRPAGGAYNVDWVLTVMVRGLEEELRARMSGSKIYGANRKGPSLPLEISGAILEQRIIDEMVANGSDEDKDQSKSMTIPSTTALPILQQGGDVTVFVKLVQKGVGWWRRKQSKAR